MNYNVYASGPRKGQCKLLRDRIIRYLEEGAGYKVVDSRTKSTKLSTNDPNRFMYVGKNGSIRVGKTKTTSLNAAQTTIQRMINWESEKGLPQD